MGHPKTWRAIDVQGDLANPYIIWIFGQVERISADRGLHVFITSIREGRHGRGSRHPWGLGFDWRNTSETTNHKGTPVRGDEFQTEINRRLAASRPSWPIRCEVVDEGDHFHVEYEFTS